MSDPRECEHCGSVSCTKGVCWRIKKIEYQDDGLTIRSIEYHPPQPLVVGSQFVPASPITPLPMPPYPYQAT